MIQEVLVAGSMINLCSFDITDDKRLGLVAKESAKDKLQTCRSQKSVQLLARELLRERS